MHLFLFSLGLCQLLILPSAFCSEVQRVSTGALEAARRSYGTDEDLLLVRSAKLREYDLAVPFPNRRCFFPCVQEHVYSHYLTRRRELRQCSVFGLREHVPSCNFVIASSPSLPSMLLCCYHACLHVVAGHQSMCPSVQLNNFLTYK